MNEEPSQQVGIFVSRKLRIGIWFEHLYVVMWSEKKLVHNYTVLTFHRNCGEVILRHGGRK